MTSINDDDLERPFNPDAPWPAPRCRTSLELAEKYGGPAKVDTPLGGWNAPMTNEEICRTWPGAHLDVTCPDEKPRWILRPHRARGCCTPCEAT